MLLAKLSRAAINSYNKLIYLETSPILFFKKGTSRSHMTFGIQINFLYDIKRFRKILIYIIILFIRDERLKGKKEIFIGAFVVFIFLFTTIHLQADEPEGPEGIPPKVTSNVCPLPYWQEESNNGITPPENNQTPPMGLRYSFLYVTGWYKNVDGHLRLVGLNFTSLLNMHSFQWAHHDACWQPGNSYVELLGDHA
jgi:hypothetical protein